jgi:uncharacterized membrane protein
MQAAAESIPQQYTAGKGSGSRLLALDWMRGLVMVLMALDHSSGEFNAGRLISDGAFLYEPGTPLPTGQFLTRWLTHLCAPTFVFLAGVALAFSIGRRVERGETAASVDRYLLLRGLIIVAAEAVPSYFWMPPGKYLFQVLYAIGTAYLLMIPLRRLPVKVCAWFALGILLLGEAVAAAAGWGPGDQAPWLATLLLTGGPRGALIVAYPTLPWLAMLLLGWVGGHALRRRGGGEPVLRSGELLRTALALLAVFMLVRAANGYGNFGLLREGHSLVQWLHVSKYPPGISYVALELGLMSLVLAGLTWLGERGLFAVRGDDPLVTFGQTPMFFYLLHIPLLAFMGEALGVQHELGLGAAYGFAVVVSALLFLPCVWYRRQRASRLSVVTRYL